MAFSHTTGRAGCRIYAQPHRCQPGADDTHTEPEEERIAIDGSIDCRDADDRHRVVLRWRRQLRENLAGEGLRWVSVGPAVFTLADASAVIQIRG